MQYLIEKAQEKDINNITDMIMERSKWLLDKEIDQWEPDYYLKKYDYNYFLSYVNQEKDLFVLKSYNNVVGSMLIKLDNNDYWKDYNDGIYLHHLVSKLGKSGIGYKLLEFAVEFAKEKGRDFIRLYCRKSNEKLNNYYINNGFSLVGQICLDDFNYNLYERKVS